jgi:hypothetical protein
MLPRGIQCPMLSRECVTRTFQPVNSQTGTTFVSDKFFEVILCDYEEVLSNVQSAWNVCIIRQNGTVNCHGVIVRVKYHAPHMFLIISMDDDVSTSLS